MGNSRRVRLARPGDRQHLIAGAQRAEELTVRYADTEHKRRFGYTDMAA